MWSNITNEIKALLKLGSLGNLEDHVKSVYYTNYNGIFVFSNAAWVLSSALMKLWEKSLKNSKLGYHLERGIIKCQTR